MHPELFQSSSFSQEIIKDTLSLWVVWKEHAWWLSITVWSRTESGNPDGEPLTFRRTCAGCGGGGAPHITLGEFTGDVFTPRPRISDSEWAGPHLGKSGATLCGELLLIVPREAIFRFSSLLNGLAKQSSPLPHEAPMTLSLFQGATLRGPCLESSLGHVDTGSFGSHWSWEQLDFPLKAWHFGCLFIMPAPICILTQPACQEPGALRAPKCFSHSALPSSGPDLAECPLLKDRGPSVFFYSLKIRLKGMRFILKTTPSQFYYMGKPYVHRSRNCRPVFPLLLAGDIGLGSWHPVRAKLD